MSDETKDNVTSLDSRRAKTDRILMGASSPPMPPDPSPDLRKNFYRFLTLGKAAKACEITDDKLRRRIEHFPEHWARVRHDKAPGPAREYYVCDVFSFKIGDWEELPPHPKKSA